MASADRVVGIYPEVRAGRVRPQPPRRAGLRSLWQTSRSRTSSARSREKYCAGRHELCGVGSADQAPSVAQRAALYGGDDVRGPCARRARRLRLRRRPRLARLARAARLHPVLRGTPLRAELVGLDMCSVLRSRGLLPCQVNCKRLQADPFPAWLCDQLRFTLRTRCDGPLLQWGNLKYLRERTDMPLVFLLGGWLGYVTPDTGESHAEVTQPARLDEIASVVDGACAKLQGAVFICRSLELRSTSGGGSSEQPSRLAGGPVPRFGRDFGRCAVVWCTARMARTDLCQADGLQDSSPCACRRRPVEEHDRARQRAR